MNQKTIITLSTTFSFLVGGGVGFFLNQQMKLDQKEQGPMGASTILGEVKGRELKKAALDNSEQMKLHEVDEKYYETVDQLLSERYLNEFFEDYARSEGLDVVSAREKYFASHTVQEEEVKAMLEKFQDHPQLQQFSDEEKKQQIFQYLMSNKRMGEMQSLVAKAKQKGHLKVSLPKPLPPRLDLDLDRTLAYGPEEAPVTVTAFVDMQCPMCVRAHRLLEESSEIKRFKGQVRWAVKAFPLNFHPEAKPAAVALRCIYKQSNESSQVFEKAYNLFYDGHQELGEPFFQRVALDLGLEEQAFQSCLKDPSVEALVDAELQEGLKLGVGGTPTFFVNGIKVLNSPDVIAAQIEREIKR